MRNIRYLKNAWADKDADGAYWLYIQSSEGQAMFCLSECIDLHAEENATGPNNIPLKWAITESQIRKELNRPPRAIYD